jgi:hypothetical protein
LGEPRQKSQEPFDLSAKAEQASFFIPRGFFRSFYLLATFWEALGAQVPGHRPISKVGTKRGSVMKRAKKGQRKTRAPGRFSFWLSRKEERAILFLLALATLGGMIGVVRDRFFWKAPSAWLEKSSSLRAEP